MREVSNNNDKDPVCENLFGQRKVRNKIDAE